MVFLLTRLSAVAILFFVIASPQSLNLNDLMQQGDNALPLTDQLMADQLASQISSYEWLGMLAPVALSPFFGIACLCGMSQFGSSFFGGTMANSFISTNPVLNNPTVFWVFLGLTILTSLPRLTKVSKPMAQAVDQLETYSGIVTLVIVRMMTGGGGEEVAIAAPVVMKMGVFSFSADILLSIAAVLNVFVINTVKFFFEVMVWLTPFPFIDAMFEAGNKATVAALMAIYAYSPFIATILNLILLAACLFCFFWIRRRVVYMRSMLCDPIWAMVNKSFGIPAEDSVVAFPKTRLGPFPSKTKLRVSPTDSGWSLTQKRLLLSDKTHELKRDTNQLEMKAGMFVNRLLLSGEGLPTESVVYATVFRPSG